MSRRICPAGWHVPGDAEWQTLIDFLGGAFVAGVKLKETGTAHWDVPNESATNENGFDALPGGIRVIGHFSTMGYDGLYWSSTENGGNVA